MQMNWFGNGSLVVFYLYFFPPCTDSSEHRASCQYEMHHVADKVYWQIRVLISRVHLLNSNESGAGWLEGN